ncbi:MAG: DUF748 domain-containing protein [bacterium]|nr:DUF748 domain-containing protein [bacterium]
MKIKIKCILLYCISSFVVFLILLYFVVTSSFFLKNFGVSIVGNLLDTKISVSDINISPLRGFIKIDGVKLGPEKDPFLITKHLYIKFDLLSLFSGKIKSDKVDIDGVDGKIILDSKGKFNIPLLNYETPKKLEEELIKAEKSKSSILLNISNISLKNINLTYRQYNKNNKEFITTSIKNYNVTSKSIVTDKKSILSYEGSLSCKLQNSLNITTGNLKGSLEFELDAHALPKYYDLINSLNNISGLFIKNSLNKYSFDIHSSGSFKNNFEEIHIDKLDITQKFNNKNSSRIHINGKVITEPFGLNFNINATPISKNMISLASAIIGNYDTGNTSLNYNGNISLDKDILKNESKVNLTDISLITPDFAFIPISPINISLNSKAELNLNTESLTVHNLTYKIIENKKEIVNTVLNKPLNLSFKKGSINLQKSDSVITVNVNNFQLQSFDKFIPKKQKVNILSGYVNSEINIKVNSENRINIDGKIKTTNLGIKAEGYKFNNINIEQYLYLNFNNLNEIYLKHFDTNIRINDKKLTELDLSGKYRIKEEDGDLFFNIPYINENVADLIPDSLTNSKTIKEVISSKPLKVSFKINSSINIKKKELDVFPFNFQIERSDNEITKLYSEKLFRIHFDNLNAPISENIPIGLSIKNFTITDLNYFLDNKIKLKSGHISSNIILDVEKDLKLCRIAGSFNFINLQYAINSVLYPEFYIINNINTEISSDLSVNIKNLKTKIAVAKKPSANLKANGNVTIKNNPKININGSFDIANREILTLIPGYTGENIVSNFKSNTSFNLISSPKKKEISAILNTKLSHLTLTPPNSSNTSIIDFNGNIKAQLNIVSNTLKLNEFELILNKNKDPIVDLTAKAVLPLDLNSSNSYFSLNSKRIDLKELESISQKLFKSKNEKVEHKNISTVQSNAKKEPNSLELNGLNLKGAINLNGISYGKEINSKIKAVLNIENNTIKLSPLYIDINKTPIIFYILAKTQNNYIVFNINGKFKNLDISPFINLMDNGSFKNVKGRIDSFSLTANGDGVSKVDLDKNLKGKLSIELSNLSIPGILAKTEYTQVIFLPLELMGSIRQLMPGGILPSNVMNAVNNTKDIFSNRKNINIKDGHILLVLNKGRVDINKFLFTGKKTIIKKIDINGNVGLNQSISLTTDSNISSVRFPLEIKGTLDKPIPNIPLFISKFVTDNAINIINPMNVVDFSVDYGKGVSKTFKGTADGMNEASVKAKNTFTNSYNAVDSVTKKFNSKTFFNLKKEKQKNN